MMVMDQSKLSISYSFGIHPIYSALGIWGSLLPHKEDSIPSWSHLLELFLDLMEMWVRF